MNKISLLVASFLRMQLNLDFCFSLGKSKQHSCVVGVASECSWSFFFFTIKIGLFQRARHTSVLVGRIGPMYVISIGLLSFVPLFLSKQHVDHAAHDVLRSLWRLQKVVGESKVKKKSCLKPLQVIPHDSIHSRVFHSCTLHSWSLVYHMCKQKHWRAKDRLQYYTKIFWFWSVLLTLKTDHRCLE